ncbi:hypothetical protein FA95DRAFT_1511631 [Auriscalpium vulgare]|uniref:Uncharacterized protein n=1 Tax=Auriscalpium vulgare TaxID=40419 RepID=A0ACB8S6B4_9AGAM|nr:hypothetical protein FA95DRAFT_1511631 [Auriscalpium vulgare]
MPKAPSNLAASSNRPSLRRNQACLSCRKRKLKCDAARPHCGTCSKQWQAQIGVPPPPGYVHPTEPQCSYDPVEGLPLAPDVDPLDKIKELEELVAQLQRKVKASATASPSSRSVSPSRFRPQTGHGRSFSASSPPNPLSASTAYSPGYDGQSSGSLPSIALPQASLDVNAMSIDRMIHSESPELHSNHSALRSDPLTSLIHSGWNPDLPEPTVLERYVDVFFKCDPCGSRVLHRPAFLASLRLPPKNPGFPHPAVLHAICASASRWISKNIVTLPDGTRRDRFAEFHARQTRQYIDRTMASGEDIFPVMQACVLLSWYFYSEGRWVEVWIFAGFQTRVAIPLRLNYPGTFAGNVGATQGAYLDPPKDSLELELRRRTWWMTVLFDRIVSVGGWVHALDERDIGTELPLRSIDFESNHAVSDNPQHLSTPNVYIEHPSQYTDSFLLLVKALMLFGKVTDFNVRTTLRTPAATSKIQNPFRLPGFEELDRLVCADFVLNFPPKFKDIFGGADSLYGGGGLDTDLFMVHMAPHAAAITLHNPYLDFSDPQNISTARCMDASRAILTQHYALTATSFDITRLHPFAPICWYLAAVVQIQLCKYCIEVGDTDREYIVWGEINVLRFAMTAYGQRCPIGTRQEKLLQGLMAEIVRMTTQQQPLEVGIPLYPFSHAGVFHRSQGQDEDEPRPAHIAPLPLSPQYDDDLSSPAHGSVGTPVLSPPGLKDVGGGWNGNDRVSYTQ